jgi:hypothetical protein
MRVSFFISARGKRALTGFSRSFTIWSTIKVVHTYIGKIVRFVTPPIGDEPTRIRPGLVIDENDDGTLALQIFHRPLEHIGQSFYANATFSDGHEPRTWHHVPSVTAPEG